MERLPLNVATIAAIQYHDHPDGHLEPTLPADTIIDANVSVGRVVGVKALILLLLAVCVGRGEAMAQEPLFRFGAIADCQYCNATSTTRKYSLSAQKLASCVQHFNKLDLAFVVHLGDFIDRDFQSFSKVIPIYNRLKAPHYHVLGNHDFSVADDEKERVPAKLGMKSRYYDLSHKGWRFIVLDGNDISLHAYSKNDPRTAAAKAFHRKLKAGTPAWNGAIGSQQMQWIKRKLKESSKNKERVILFCHFPVYPENSHNLWNAAALNKLLAGYSCVVAYINGHNHAGNYGLKDHVHYITLKGMVDTTENAYSIFEVYEDVLQLKGEGRQGDRRFTIQSP